MCFCCICSIHFLTAKYHRTHRDHVEPIVCGRVPPGRKARRLEIIVKSVILNEYATYACALFSSCILLISPRQCILLPTRLMVLLPCRSYAVHCYISAGCSVIAELERMEPYGPYDSVSLTNYLHRRGINMRLLGTFAYS